MTNNKDKQQIKKLKEIRWIPLSLFFPDTRHPSPVTYFCHGSLVTLLASIILFIFVNPAGSEKNPNYKPALPGWKYEFPRDHRVHREFKTEWWYYNGYLRGPEGKRFGYQVTFFRVGLIPDSIPKTGSRWHIREVYMTHLAVTDINHKTFLYQEKAGRANLGLAGADKDQYRVWVEKWQVIEEGKGHQIRAGDGDLSLSLKIIPTLPPLIHGVNGISRKGDGIGRASHYYSMTRMETKGQIKIKGKKFQVSGLSWMDHEFGSNQLQETQIGWDWFSLQLDNGLDLMIYQLRHEDGRVDPNSSGTLAGPDSRKIHLALSEIKIRVLNLWKSPRSGAIYPASWEIYLPQHDLRLTLVPLTADQELMTPNSTRITYWEGIVKVRGSYKGRIVEGSGYVEMTGYDRRFRPKI
ncbi:MAG: carotenoid 1,2-hydratase [Deltaproteobacteria bacterium]|nr:carotenoid 1,2-hydratase [Deltaproteobacteria bacterium]